MQALLHHREVTAVAVFPYSEEPPLLKFLRGILCTEFSQIAYGLDCGMNILMWERVSY